MLYKPKFCCNCGEKVERKEWRPWSSGRFCEVCEADNRLRDWLPRAAGIVAVLGGLFSVGMALQEVEKPLNITRQAQAANLPERQPANANAADVRRDLRAAPKDVERTEKDPEPQKDEAEPVYFCGARTKKGKPCTRAVKGGGRCWQHKGFAALVVVEKPRAEK